jgi:hypothetical protein
LDIDDEYLLLQEVGRDKVTVTATPIGRMVWSELARAGNHTFVPRFANQLLSLHATSCRPERNWSVWRAAYGDNCSRLQVEKAAKMIFISSQARLKRKDLVDDSTKDLDLLIDVDVGAPDARLVEIFDAD